MYKLLILKDDEEIEKMLKETGLDPNRWMRHFKNIGVTTRAALMSCGPEQFDELSQFADEKAVERKALRKFLGMPDESYNTKVGSYLS